jgi:5S rRNA maturation endonuclease (ribonuclease M5)
MSSPVEDLISRLHAKRSGEGWITTCPAHDDREPSLSISEGADGRVLLHCHAGCSTDAILAALSMTYRDLFPAKFSQGRSAPRRGNQLRLATSQSADDFLSKQGCLRAIEMAVMLRETPNLCERLARARGWKPETIGNLSLEPSLGWHDGKFAFIYETGVKLRWRQHGERIIRWAFGKPWLWRGSYIDIATTVYLCEGETDAISLIDAGLESDGQTIAVAIPSASTFHEPWATLFVGKEVILAFDADRPGEQISVRVSRLLQPHVASLKRLNWKGVQRAS